MMNELITQESEMVVRMLGKLERTLAYVEQLTENYRPILDGERATVENQPSHVTGAQGCRTYGIHTVGR